MNCMLLVLLFGIVLVLLIITIVIFIKSKKDEEDGIMFNIGILFSGLTVSVLMITFFLFALPNLNFGVEKERKNIMNTYKLYYVLIESDAIYSEECLEIIADYNKNVEIDNEKYNNKWTGFMHKRYYGFEELDYEKAVVSYSNYLTKNNKN